METKTQKTPEYPYLPPGKILQYISESNKYMSVAKEVALTQSTDKKISTGAVIVNEAGEILASGANQSALKNKFLLETHNSWCFRKIFHVPSGEKYWLCPGCASHKNHAEHRAVSALQTKFPEQIDLKPDLYLWGHWWCCEQCWDKMIKAGINNVYLMEGANKLFK